MQIEYRCTKGLLEYHFHLGHDDLSKSGIKMGEASCEIHMPPDWDIDKVHPDVIALASILIIYPFAGSRIELPHGVSQSFHDLFKRTTKKEILPVDPNLTPRKAPHHSVPALAFSGGIDSTAALLLLPGDSCVIFLERITPLHQKTIYNKEAALLACNTLHKEGRNVYIIKSNLEYVREPVGFPVDIANAVPGLLLSDYVGLDSVAWGTVMDSTYQVSHLKFADYSQRLHFIRWGKLFELVGMPFNQVTGGICEVGTSIIVKNSSYRTIARSCMRGTAKMPCGTCWKCFRKGLLDRVLDGSTPSHTEFDRFFSLPHIKRTLNMFPIHSENIITYITAHYDGDHPIMNKLKKRTRGDTLPVKWMEKWYQPSIRLLPEKYRRSVEKQITKRLDVMNSEDERQAESWDLETYRATDEFQQYSAELRMALDSHLMRPL
ncbi:DUF6395 domain-containing protein [Paenibacillus jiagnxiensis]|uniref:DUF6395 domain-containing protein n=1 Tax=Paenibacillus jiagnxiensis TaxID=3228926 RepID=UPI0033A572D8